MFSPLFSAFTTIHGIHDFFHSTGFVIARNVAVFLAIVFWIALAYWVHRDARRRIGDPLLVGMASLLGLVPPYLGPIVYLLFRPAETLDDVRSRQAELQALEQQLARALPTCPTCFSPVEPDYLACPVCAEVLREPCTHCNAALEPLWQVCPYCTQPVEPLAADLDTALTAEARSLAALPEPGQLLEPEPRVADA